MLSYIMKKIGIHEFESEQQKVFHTFRYFSWFFTSLFYFFGNPPSHWIFKLAVIILLYISVVIITKAYKKYGINTEGAKAFVIFETVGIILVLLPTGGLNSPFIWYALNPVLISTGFPSPYFCWLNLFGYLSASAVIPYLLFNENGVNLFGILSANSHLILIFILITLVAKLMTGLTNKLKEQRNELQQANILLKESNKRTQETMEHIMSLYQVVEALATQHNPRHIYQTFVDYTAKLTRSDLVFYWIESDEKNEVMQYTTGIFPQSIEGDLMNSLGNLWGNKLQLDNKVNLDIGGYTFIVVVVKSLSKEYGMIGIRIDNLKSDIVEYGKQLEFVSELSAITLERLHLEEVNERLMVAEEQNRIANEMHDSVAQRLFGISYMVHSVIQKWEDMTTFQMQEKFLLLQDSARLAMKELRSTIYGLSSRKEGRKSFQEDTMSYLDNISKLNDIAIDVEFTGDEQLLGLSEKRGLYRVICEATGNAIRHGKCTLLFIRLTIGDFYTELSISDNGKGFDVTNLGIKNGYGLGLQNMERLVNELGGSFDIHSEIDVSTIVQVTIPNKKANSGTINKKGALQL
ncbi:sensor histidine kinase [Lederbergia panacisoli]|uniref:sensor histidine kinase n=1 Tax=Lederbergia panacisoli TaxID=1255251 RepID=UPI00214C9AE4|nr:sensor histidine kinase [Lederbergia panacisoli]MCR2823283.1 sensor histidine kinase [Lederbergia panacisoli]